MRKFIVVIFANETKAYEGTRAFQDLNAEGSLTLYGMSVVVKYTDGRLSVKQAVDQGPLGAAAGTLTGGLIGFLGGPVGAVIGMGGGALVGSIVDLFDLGISARFMEEIARELTDGKTAIIADVEEEWVTPLDSRMEALDGIVLREWRTEAEDAMYIRAVHASKAELSHLKAELAQAREEDRAKLRARVEEAQVRLQASLDHAQAWLDQRKAETEAKVKAIQEQAAKDREDARAKREAYIAEMHTDFNRRSEKLSEARELAKEALKP